MQARSDVPIFLHLRFLLRELQTKKIETMVVSPPSFKNLSQRVRDPTCGVNIFKEGTEQSLLDFVQHGLVVGAKTNPLGGFALQEKVKSLIDDFCLSRHWMMHIGPQKGNELESFIVESLDNVLARPGVDPFVVVEVGTYCGYSCILMCLAILQQLDKITAPSSSSSPARTFHIFTVDVNPANVAVAQKMISLAGLEEHVTFLLLEDPATIPTELSITVASSMRGRFPNRPATIDFLFLDHDKQLYLPDLQQLEQANLVVAGTYVAADNVIYSRNLDCYRQYLQSFANDGVVKTCLKDGMLGYVNEQTKDEVLPNHDLRDGVGKYQNHLDYLSVLHSAVPISNFCFARRIW